MCQGRTCIIWRTLHHKSTSTTLTDLWLVGLTYQLCPIKCKAKYTVQWGASSLRRGCRLLYACKPVIVRFCGASYKSNKIAQFRPAGCTHAAISKNSSMPLKRLNHARGPRPAGNIPPRHELSPSMRSRIVQAREDGLSWSNIQEQVTENGRELPLRTPRSVVQRFASRTSFHSHERERWSAKKNNR